MAVPWLYSGNSLVAAQSPQQRQLQDRCCQQDVALRFWDDGIQFFGD
jgi:hypothetical protein